MLHPLSGPRAATLRSLLEMQFGFVFQPLVSETHLTGCRPIDIGAPENFFTISQVPQKH